MTGRQKSRDFLLSQPAIKDRKSSSRSSLYSQENSITEEDDEDDVFNDSPIIQGGEITSTVFDECEEIELGVSGHKGESDQIVVEEQQNLSLNVTGWIYFGYVLIFSLMIFKEEDSVIRSIEMS